MNNEKEFDFLNDKKTAKKVDILGVIYYIIIGFLKVLYFIVDIICSIIEGFFILDTALYAIKPKKKKRKKGWF
jgi:hypothetical protein